MNRCSQCTLAHYLHMMVSAAADCHFVLSMECGDMSPLWEFWNWRADSCLRFGRPKSQSGDKSPHSKSKSGDESPHSKIQGSNTNNRRGVEGPIETPYRGVLE